MAEELVRLDRLTPALVKATTDDRWRETTAELISGGKSNLTFLLSSSAGELILRRPPTGELLASAHDMMREARVQAALANTEVPVASIVLVDDGNLIGIPCYVMRRVPGHVVRDRLPRGYAGAHDDRRGMAQAYVDTLVRLHGVDFDAVGLGDYGRPAGFMERQVRRWTGQWAMSKTHDVPEIEELANRLLARVPKQQRHSIVHGDYRFDNIVFDLSDPNRINAVLDWELSALGDPLSDLGLLMLFWREPGEAGLPLVPGVTHLDGFPSRAEVLERYAATSGVDLSTVGFYHAFAHFKFAVIAQGVQARAQAGAMGGQDFGDLNEDVRALAADGLDCL